MRKIAVYGFALGFCLVLPTIADQKPPVFFFGGNRFYIGMSQPEALAALTNCCKLSPTIESGVEKRPAPEGMILGHLIVANGDDPFHILGSISFRNGKVVRMTKPLDNDIDTYNDELVAFARALKRSLPSEAIDSEVTIRLSVQHERVSNAESDTVSLLWPNGRSIQLHIGTLDKPQKEINKRDFVTMEEILE